MRKLIRGILAHQKRLGITPAAFIPTLVEAVFDLYQGRYPYLAPGKERLLDYFAEESARFDRTLAAGYHQLGRMVQSGKNGAISGQQALELVKQQGVPLLLLESELARREIAFDRPAYREAYTRWRQVVTGAR